jgi:hypothetical protein
MKRQTKDGQEIEVKDLSNWHLANLYKLIKHKEVNWLTIVCWWWSDPDDYRYDEDTYYWEDMYKIRPIYREIVDEYERHFNSNNLDFLHHNWYEWTQEKS